MSPLPDPDIKDGQLRDNLNYLDRQLAAKGSVFPSGGVIPFAGSDAPPGWLLCDGSAVSRTDYARLFAVVSTTYGSGDSSTTFNVPDLRGRAPYGKGTNTDNDALGESDGIAEASRSPKHTLTTDEMPSHAHAVAAIGQTFTGAGTTYLHASAGAGTGLNPQTAGAGGDGPHDHGFLVLNFIIKT